MQVSFEKNRGPRKTPESPIFMIHDGCDLAGEEDVLPWLELVGEL